MSVHKRILPVLLILGLVIWVMLPALRQPEGAMLCDWMHPDCISNQWLLVWVAEQLESGRSILHNGQYYWPYGDAPVLAGNGSEGVAYLLFHLLLGWPLGVVGFVSCVLMLNGLGGYCLGRAIGADRSGALIPAATAVVNPYVLTELWAGRYSQVSIGWMLLTLAAWLRLLEKPSHKRALTAGGLWAVTAFFYWYYAWFVALGLIGLLGARAIAKPPTDWRAAATAGGIAAVLIAPWGWLFARHWGQLPGTSETFPPAQAAWDSIRLRLPMTGDPPDVGALSVLVMGLGLLGALQVLRRGSPTQRWALGTAVLFVLLAMGPWAAWAPYTWLYDLAPPLRRFWWPLRHIALAGVLWACLAALWLKGRSWGPLLAWLTALSTPLLISAMGDSAQVQLTQLDLSSPGIPALSELPDGVLLQLPIAPEASGVQLPLLNQMVHHKTMLGGHAQWVDRVRPAAWDARLRDNSFLSGLASIDRGESGTSMHFEGTDLEQLQEAGLRWLVLERTTYVMELQPAVRAHKSAATELFGPPIVRERGLWAWDMQQWTGAEQASIPPLSWPAGLEQAGPERPLTGRRPHPPIIQIQR